MRFRPRGGAPVAEMTEDDLVLPDDAAPLRLDARAGNRAAARGLHRLHRRRSRLSPRRRRRRAGSSAAPRGPRMPISRSSPTTPRRSGAPRSGCRTSGPAARRADFALPPSRLALAPGDVIALTAGGRRRLARTARDRRYRAAPHRGARDRSGCVRAAARAAAPAAAGAAGADRAGACDCCSNCRRCRATTRRCCARLAVFADPWPGPVAVWRSLDDGASYQRVRDRRGARRSSARRSTICRGADQPLGQGRNRVRVRLYGGALASASDLRVLGGANAAAVQRPDGAWEVLQFANAVLVGERTYRTLAAAARRGRQRMGDRRRRCRPARRSCCSTSMSCRSRAGSTWSGGACVSASSRRAATTAIRARSRSCCGRQRLRCSRSRRCTCGRGRETGGVRFSWRPRRRGLAGVSFAARADSRRGERSLRARNSVRRRPCVRTLATTAPSTLYAASDEIARLRRAQSSFAVRLYQISAAVGRGLPAAATLTP